MEKQSVFEDLAAKLSAEERREMIEKIRRSFSIASEPLFVQHETSEDIDVAVTYERAGFLTRLIVFIISLFTGKERLQVMEERMIKTMIRKIEREHPGLVNVSQETALYQMYGEFEALEQAASVFKLPLDTAFNITKKDFVTFLACSELENVQEKLLESTDPQNCLSELTGKDEKAMKKYLEFKMEDIFLDISDSDRERIQGYMRSLYYLKSFSDYPFYKILNRFKSSDTAQKVCDLGNIEDHLTSLADTLAGLRVPPDANVVQTLFLFLYQREMEDDDFDLEDRMKRQVERADQALGSIRNFSHNVPLVDIIRFVKHNINYRPLPRGGGEDWFVLFKMFWRERLDAKFEIFARKRKRNRIIEETLDFLEIDSFPFLEHYRSGSLSDLVEVRNAFTAGFLVAYIERMIVVTFNRMLKMILIDAEFYKDQNRKDFTDSYNTLQQTAERLRQIDGHLAPDGYLGKMILDTEQEIITRPLKKKKVDNILHKIEPEIGKLVREGFENLQLLQNVLGGILHGEVGGRFDTIANLGYIGGRGSKKLKEDLGGIISSLNTAGEILDQLSKID